MKKSAVVTSGAIVCVLALFVAGAAIARPHATSVRVSTTMNAAQEVPALKGDVGAARGTFTATVTKSGTGASLNWEMTFSGLTGPANAAHIHTGETGEAGPVVVPLCGPCQSPASGTANADAAVLEALQNSGTYVNVHTATNGPGEIRGQIGVTASIRTTLTSRQEVPKPKGNVRRATGMFTATIVAGDTTRLSWRLTFARLTGRATTAHIHVGREVAQGTLRSPSAAHAEAACEGP